jgi:hypothetical protein
MKNHNPYHPEADEIVVRFYQTLKYLNPYHPEANGMFHHMTNNHNPLSP